MPAEGRQQKQHQHDSKQRQQQFSDSNENKYARVLGGISPADVPPLIQVTVCPVATGRMRAREQATHVFPANHPTRHHVTGPRTDAHWRHTSDASVGDVARLSHTRHATDGHQCVSPIPKVGAGKQHSGRGLWTPTARGSAVWVHPAAIQNLCVAIALQRQLKHAGGTKPTYSKHKRGRTDVTPPTTATVNTARSWELKPGCSSPYLTFRLERLPT